MEGGIRPLTIDITPRAGGGYKSITTLSWADIPALAILTGKNGSGKTQLLELLAYHFSGALPPGLPPPPAMPVEIRVSGSTYKPEEIAFVPSAGRFSGGTAASLATMMQFYKQDLNRAKQLGGSPLDIQTMISARRISSRLGGRNLQQTTPEELAELSSGADFVADDIDITVNLSRVFVAHRFKIVEALERATPGFDEGGKPLGPAPWDVVNDALAIAGFSYKVISPTKTKLIDAYKLRLEDLSSGAQIDATELSSGEKVLLQLVLWLYSAGTAGQFPKLLLLDEPDAHLHPSMTMQFLDVISEVLVNRHGVRVIMTTHSPSTVALAPEGSVFTLERGSNVVKRVDHRPEIISVLTAGLVTVSRTTKFCLVEDADDVNFYKAVAEILMDHGPSRDKMALRPSPSIVFIPASAGNGREKTPGGYTVVTKWVNKLDAEPLSSTFFGIIDRDAANVASDRVYVIGRYSIENYLLDPLNLFALLLEHGSAPPIPGVRITSGDEHQLRLQPADILQAIADKVTKTMEQASPQLVGATRVGVNYTVGAQIFVPSWVINHRGHDLLPIAQCVFGGPRVVTPPRLIKAMQRGRLVPSELAGLLAKIQCA